METNLTSVQRLKSFCGGIVNKVVYPRAYELDVSSINAHKFLSQSVAVHESVATPLRPSAGPFAYGLMN